MVLLCLSVCLSVCLSSLPALVGPAPPQTLESAPCSLAPLSPTPQPRTLPQGPKPWVQPTRPASPARPLFPTPAGKGDLQPQLDSALQDVNDMYLLLEETEKQAVRRALIEERGRFCTFITFLQPVVVGLLMMWSPSWGGAGDRPRIDLLTPCAPGLKIRPRSL